MTFVGAVVASIACMACCLRVRGAAHSGGTRQARQSRHAASESIGEDRAGSDAQLLLSTGGGAPPPPIWSGAPTGVRIVRGGVLGNGRLGPAGAPPNQVATGAPRHRSRIER